MSPMRPVLIQLKYLLWVRTLTRKYTIPVVFGPKTNFVASFAAGFNFFHFFEYDVEFLFFLHTNRFLWLKIISNNLKCPL